jgi:hypothetical protein
MRLETVNDLRVLIGARVLTPTLGYSRGPSEFMGARIWIGQFAVA